MATYPSLPVHIESKRLVRDGRSEEFAENGKSYVRRLYSTDKFDFAIKHEALTSANMSTLQSFYNTNQNLAIDFTWPEDGVTYTGLKFGAGGFRTEPNKQLPTCRDVYVRLVGP